MSKDFDVITSDTRVGVHEPIFPKAADALQLTKEQLAGLFERGWTVWGTGFRVGKEPRPFELRNYARTEYGYIRAFLRAFPPAGSMAWDGDGADALLLDLGDVNRTLGDIEYYFHVGDGRAVPGPSEIHPLNYATTGDAQPLVTPACGPAGCVGDAQLPAVQAVIEKITGPKKPQTGKDVFKFCGDAREELGTAKSKATTTNPKDLFGAVKVSVSKLPAAGVIHGAHAMMDGAVKYGPYNWRDKSVIASIYVDAAQRHLMSWFEGQETASDSGVHHLGHAIACMAIILDAQETGSLVDDRPGMGGDADAILQRLNAAIKARKEGAK